jgi:hypothetical protein
MASEETAAVAVEAEPALVVEIEVAPDPVETLPPEQLLIDSQAPPVETSDAPAELLTMSEDELLAGRDAMLPVQSAEDDGLVWITIPEGPSTRVEVSVNGKRRAFKLGERVQVRAEHLDVLKAAGLKVVIG